MPFVGRDGGIAATKRYYRRMSDRFDILIVGGGLVGTSAAIALDGCGLRVALVEAAPLRADHQPAYDERNLALARASVNALTALGVWRFIGERATPIRRIHVSRQGEFGAVRLDAAAHGVDAFGQVLPARELGNALLRRLHECGELVRFAPAKLVDFRIRDDDVEVRIDNSGNESTVRTRLLVGADGAASFVRATLGIGVDQSDYAQTAFVCTVTPQRAPESAYERFTAHGPVAVLPLAERRAGVVLTVSSADALKVAALDDDGFLDLLHTRFGYRLGRLGRPGKRTSYPLRRVRALRTIADRAVLVGNAAQSLHPIAAQGFNLGLRDALTLAETILDHGGDAGAAGVLREYVERRRVDRDGTIAMSDGLARWSADQTLPVRYLRGLAFAALDRIGPLQSALVRRGMGFRGNMPRLALGADA